jgi:hypothetical protein
VASYRDEYGVIDKALHYLSFKTSRLQIAFADQESEDYRQQLNSIKIRNPVFITALPRAGTSVLLDVLVKTGAFSYHSYQDMPFLLTPLIWARFTQKFAKTNSLKERAHKDGIKINQQSPEAFEEMLYKAFWPTAYTGESIPLWKTVVNKKFDHFFIDHVKKIVWRDVQKKEGATCRYISKNNLNVTRFSYVRRLFPDCLFVTPFRDPVQHAWSMLKQHRNFCELQRGNTFVLDYMTAIGHYDFGLNLKPVDFGGWFQKTQFSPDSLNFWLEYWIHAYGHMIDVDSESKFFVDFDNLCRNPKSGFRALSEYLKLDAQALDQSVHFIKVAETHQVGSALLDPHNLKIANILHQRLLSGAVNR